MHRLESTLDDARFVYVMDGLSSPRPRFVDDGAVGFNLDGLDSGRGSTSVDADCEAFSYDLPSRDEPGHVGVDNALATIIPAAEGLMDPVACDGDVEGCIQRTVDALLASEELLVMIEIRHVDDLAADASVEVGVYEGRRRPDGTVERVRSLGEAFEASVFAGRVRARFELVEIPFPLIEVPLPPTRHHGVELRMAIDRDRVFGVMGGGLLVEDVVQRAAPPDERDGTRSLVESAADLRPSRLAPVICTEVSFGYALHAIRVETT